MPSAYHNLWKFREWKQRKQASHANQFVLDHRSPLAHQMMWKNQHKRGNMAVLVNAPRAGLRNFEDVVEAAGGA